VSQQNIKTTLLPLEEALRLTTEKWREEQLNPQVQLIFLANPILKNAGVPKKKWNEFRNFAFAWAKKYASNPHNTAWTQSEKIIALDDFTQAGSFFTAAKRKGYLKSGGLIDRGHVNAVVKEQVEEALESTIEELSFLGAPASVISKFSKVVQAKLNKVKPPKIRYNFERKISEAEVDGEFSFVAIFPEPSRDNRSKGWEKKLKPELTRVVKKFIDDHIDDIPMMKGSKSIMQATDEMITQTIKGKKGYKYDKNTSGTIKADLRKTRAKKAKTAEFPKVRDTKGRFTSPLSIMNLINSRLHNQLRTNMRSPALNYQTGRFAKSVRITNISQTRQNQMTAFYTYMKSPYQTFERGYAQGSIAARDPRTIISKSIREIAAQIMGSQFDIRTRRQ